MGTSRGRPAPAADHRSPGREPLAPPGAGDARRGVEALCGVPLTDGNAVRVLRNGVEMFPAMLDMIGSATRSVDLASFIWESGPVTEEFTDALSAAARRGARVRVLLDGFGSQHADLRQLRRMRAAGCSVVVHRPLHTWRPSTLNRRMHQRILVCDHAVGFTGGVGIDQAWTGDADRPDRWRDTGVQVRGPAVDGLRGAFTRNWLQTPHDLADGADRFPDPGRPGTAAAQVIASRSGAELNGSALVMAVLLHLAVHRVRISTPYVRLPGRLHDLLAATAARGVQVQILTSGPHTDRPSVQLQSQRQWQRLLDAGVELWLYQPTLFHPKVRTVDGRIATVGTSNLDIRSFTLNSQLDLVVDDTAVTEELDAQFDADLARSSRLRGADWQARGLHRRALEIGAHLAGTPIRGLGPGGLTARNP